MRAVLAWGPVALDLDIHSVEYNKATKATCEVYYFNSLCSGSKWMVDNYNVSKKKTLLIVILCLRKYFCHFRPTVK
jgi:hypothetical protein